MKERIEIPVSKVKVFWLFIGCLVFVLLGIAALQMEDVSVFKKVISGIAIVFFGLGLYAFPKKLLDKTPGMVIDKYGVTDNVTNPRVGTIDWKDIAHVEVSYIETHRARTKVLLIFVHDPEKYLSKIKGWKCQGLKNNYAETGTPFVLPSSLLKMKLEEIKDLIDANMI